MGLICSEEVQNPCCVQEARRKKIKMGVDHYCKPLYNNVIIAFIVVINSLLVFVFPCNLQSLISPESASASFMFLFVGSVVTTSNQHLSFAVCKFRPKSLYKLIQQQFQLVPQACCPC